MSYFLDPDGNEMSDHEPDLAGTPSCSCGWLYQTSLDPGGDPDEAAMEIWYQDHARHVLEELEADEAAQEIADVVEDVFVEPISYEGSGQGSCTRGLR